MQATQRDRRARPSPASFTVTFWGVRGSIAVPGHDTVRYGGNTTCLEIRCDDTILIIDAGTGARLLGKALVASPGPIEATILFSHTHTDHIGGFPFFAPLYRDDTRLTLRGDATRDVATRESLRRLMSFPLFPISLDGVSASLDFQDVVPGAPFEVGPATVDTCRLNHPGGALAFRVEHRGRAFVHASDVEHRGDAPSLALAELCRGAAALSYDAMFVEGDDYEAHVGWGHSTWQAGVRLADVAGVERFVAMHHAPDHDDAHMDVIAEQLGSARPGSLVAVEGMSIDLLSGDVHRPADREAE